jgi:hypothetical protein
MTHKNNRNNRNNRNSNDYKIIDLLVAELMPQLNDLVVV